MTEGVIGNIFKQVGDEVAFDDPLFEVSTDKVDSEIPSPYNRVILEVLAQPGETVPVGAPVLRIGGPGATVENRLPSASHAVAAAGGRSLAEASTPSMGGSEGPATEAAGFSTPGDGAVYELTMPKLGESVTEGTISSWLKQVGDEVAFDDPLFEVSTDKVDSEIPSPYDGTLLEILVQADQTVPVGTVLARIGDKSGAPAAGAAPAGGGPNHPRRHRRQRLLPRPSCQPAMGKVDCCLRWCAGSLPSTDSTRQRYRVPEPVGGSVARMCRRRSPLRAHAPRRRPRPRLLLPLRRRPERSRPPPTPATK